MGHLMPGGDSLWTQAQWCPCRPHQWGAQSPHAQDGAGELTRAGQLVRLMSLWVLTVLEKCSQLSRSDNRLSKDLDVWSNLVGRLCFTHMHCLPRWGPGCDPTLGRGGGGRHWVDRTVIISPPDTVSESRSHTSNAHCGAQTRTLHPCCKFRSTARRGRIFTVNTIYLEDEDTESK